MTMTRRWRSPLVGSLLMLSLLLASPARAQQTPAAAPPTGPAESVVTVPITPGDLARIRRALDSEPAVRMDDEQLRFYIQILAKQPSFAEFVKGYDFKHGPTRRGNPMTHAEFVAMVTPKEMQSSLGITARETLEFALTNWLSQTLIKRAFEDLQKAKDEREVQEIRDRIERELAALRTSGER
jgi:hypothetical protein